MSLHGFQRALCDLIASPELCVAARRAPEEALARFDLTARERRRLAAMVRQPGMSVNCTLYRVNRMTPLYSLLPRSCLALGDRLADEAAEFWRAGGTDLQFGPEIVRFAAFLRERLDAGQLASPYLAELLDFELALHELRLAPRRRLLGELAAGASGRAWRVSPLVRVVRFSHEPAALLGALAEGRVPDESDAPGGDFHLLLDATGPALELRPLDGHFGAALAEAAAGAGRPPEESDVARALVEAGLLVPA